MDPFDWIGLASTHNINEGVNLSILWNKKRISKRVSRGSSGKTHCASGVARVVFGDDMFRDIGGGGEESTDSLDLLTDCRLISNTGCVGVQVLVDLKLVLRVARCEPDPTYE